MALGSTSIAAQSREQLRSQMKTSMMGRRAGMDNADYEVGEQDTRLPIDNLTTTANSSLSPNGFSILSCTAASSATYTLFGGVPGIYKQITQISSSTLGYVIQMGANAQVVSTAGSSFNQMTFAGVGHTMNLCCIASGTSLGSSQGAVWVATGVFTSTASGLSLSTY